MVREQTAGRAHDQPGYSRCIVYGCVSCFVFIFIMLSLFGL